MNDLSHAFSYASAEHLMIRKALMVGAVPGKQTLLAENDHWILKAAVRHLAEWKIPLTHDLAEMMQSKPHDPSMQSVRIMNILPEHGGEDFHASQEKAALVALCNIPRDIPEAMKLDSGYRPTSDHYRLSHTGSAQHDDLQSWRDAIERSEANIVMIHGSDSFKPDDLNSGDYVAIRIDDALSFLIKKSYFEEAEMHLHLQESPLIDMIMPLESGRNSFQYDWQKHQIREAPASHALRL